MIKRTPRYTLSQWLVLTGTELNRSQLAKLSQIVLKNYSVYNETPPLKITTPSPNTGRYTNRAYGYTEEEFYILEEAIQQLRVASIPSSTG